MIDPSIEQVGKLGNSEIRFGRYTYGLETMKICQWGEGAALKIGSFCSIAEGATFILGGNHRVDWATTFPFGFIFQDQFGGERNTGHPSTHGDIIIGNDVWIGRNATIMSGVTIGDGAVIAGNATIVKDVAPYEVWGGNPAKLIKKRFDDDVIEALLDLRWWDLPEQTIKKIAPELCQVPTAEAVNEIKAATNDPMIDAPDATEDEEAERSTLKVSLQGLRYGMGHH